MKKITLLLLLLLSNYMFAQNKLSYGLNVGLNLVPNTTDDEINANQVFTKFNGGLFIAKPLYKGLGVKLGINYAGKAKQYAYETKTSFLSSLNPFLGLLIDTASLSSVTGYVNDTVYSRYRGVSKMGFIEIPLMVTLNVKQFDIGVGGYASFLIQASSTEELSQNAPFLQLLQPALDSLGVASFAIDLLINGSYPALKKPVVSELSNSNDFITVDYGLLADITYHYTPNLFFNFRYQYGIPNYRVNPLNEKDNYTSFTLSIGYQFNRKKGS